MKKTSARQMLTTQQQGDEEQEQPTTTEVGNIDQENTVDVRPDYNEIMVVEDIE
jgi:hypothetical protein